ncbi:uncharacterized protein MELLADRAFT_59389 [Melampsora larici-populina 98AG31]|uniref:Uncharacterized protein n=1 Tax=Melampsora larici-populina (strain 98AG31 / pathotype 3-4-7) TaxID=747676 RepID=F4R7B0_MELLP|nr:uncharacterized protein MELLADRAFT_59389 [Melampsora larici-populina 98AG31]EGG11281.1 hypothetical protein MELLADRAFT_59389 [Melampsora larici-populina 98AG31]
MSNPSGIDQFNANVKRISERLCGVSDSDSPPGTQLTDLTTEENNTTADASGDKASSGSVSQGRKGKAAGAKKGPTPGETALTQPNVPPINPATASSSALQANNTGDVTTKEKIGAETPTNLGTQVAKDTLTVKSLATKDAKAQVQGSKGSNTSIAHSGGSAQPKSAGSVPLISIEVVNTHNVNDTPLPPSLGQAAAIKGQASGILSQINKCSPDGIESWLNSKGFTLVPMTPGGASTEVSRINAVDKTNGSKIIPAPSSTSSLPASLPSRTQHNSCNVINPVLLNNTPKPRSGLFLKQALELSDTKDKTEDKNANLPLDLRTSLNRTISLAYQCMMGRAVRPQTPGKIEDPSSEDMPSEAVEEVSKGTTVLEIVVLIVIEMHGAPRDVSEVMTKTTQGLRGRQSTPNGHLA